MDHLHEQSVRKKEALELPKKGSKRVPKAQQKATKRGKSHTENREEAIGIYLSRYPHNRGIPLGRHTADPKQTVRYQTILTLYAQQREMYQSTTHQIPDHIVSLHQLHIRLIVREKATAKQNSE